jgi:ABC-type multidrug transport system ATPase subunit/pSer/pThr/pTyr-binding forkhead associated (FHA) protein
MNAMDGQDFLKIRGGDKEYNYVLDRDDVTIGRADDSTLVLAQEIISRHHAKIERIKSVVYITDLDSRNGTKVNGTSIKPNEPHELANLDTITIGKFNLQLFLSLRPSKVEEISTKKPIDETQHIPLLTERPTVTIGRGPDNDIKLDHPSVSRKHARIIRQGTKEEYIIEDLGSTNGTCVNGQRIVKSAVLHRDDIINIGPYKLTYREGKLESVDESHYLGLDAINLQKKVSKGKNLLQDISLSIKPSSFVAIVGMAGSGKSTLLDVLNGFRPATSGRVLVNGNDLYANYDVYRNQLGYVPQQNIVHMGLTCYEVLNYSARLRLPLDTTSSERHERVTSVLETLGISHCKDQPVSKISGGEKRRVAMGVELLAQPGLFFLDEVTSGLDPGTEHEIMRLLHKLSREGHTILLITHATKNVTECDMVVFLARGGYLAYYGPPKEALTYFGVNDFDEIYEKLRGGSPEQWAKDYRESAQYHTYILDPLISQPQTPQNALPIKDTTKTGVKKSRHSAWNQFSTLSNRNVKLLMHDKVSLIMMLMMPLLIGLLDFIFWKPGILDASGGDPTRAIINFFFAAVVCFLVGGLASMREIIKEMDIYRRERMVCLKILPYVFSKLWISIIISLYSAGIFALFMVLAGHWPSGGQILTVYLTLFLSVLAGMVTGLLISSLSPNQNVTPLILLMFLVPQILFGGVLPEKYMGGVGRVLGAVTTTKWTYQSLVTLSDMGSCVGDEQCRADYCSGPNMFTDCNFPGIADFNDGSTDTNSAMIAADQTITRITDQYGKAFNVNLAFCWIVLLMFITGFFSLILVVLRLKDRK